MAQETAATVKGFPQDIAVSLDNYLIGKAKVATGMIESDELEGE